MENYHLYEQATRSCEYMFTMATTEEGCLVEGGARVREGRIRYACKYYVHQCIDL